MIRKHARLPSLAWALLAWVACAKTEEVSRSASDPLLEPELNVETSEQGLRKDRGGTNGASDYCNGTATCNSGEGDCDRNSECTPGLGLVCATDNGPNFGMPIGWDVCVPAHCTNRVQDSGETGVDCGGAGCGNCVCTGSAGDSNFCTPSCPCAAGLGDCDRNADCMPGLVCGVDNGPAFGLPSSWDVCVAPSMADAGIADSGTPPSSADSGVLPSVCGNGLLETGESCDDANVSGDDGCSASCQSESGYSCIGAPSACTTTCGDGVVAGNEQCDDQNQTSDDGCTACNIDGGGTCIDEPSVCGPSPFAFTQCDDGYLTVTLPFGFRFFASQPEVTTIYVSSNGRLFFSNQGANAMSQFVNTVLPTVPANGNDFIAWWWDDLYFCDAPTTFGFDVDGAAPNRRARFAFSNVLLYDKRQSSTIRLSAEIRLIETSNAIEVKYIANSASALSGTVGVQNAVGTATLDDPLICNPSCTQANWVDGTTRTYPQQP